MKKILTVLLVSLPVGAQAMGMHGCGGQGAPAMGVHLAVGLYAILAALGYWVLQHAAKETANYSKLAGQIVGWVLIVAGLGGLLCGIASHARMAGRRCCCGHEQMMQREGMQGMQGGMPENMEGMGRMNGEREMKNTPEVKNPPAKKAEAAPVRK